VGDQLDRLNDVAQRTGIGVEALQGYGAAAKLAGTDVETFARSLQKLTLNIGEAANNEKQQKAFADLGLVFDELRQKSPTEQFEAVADAISRITDPAERAAAAVSVFGKTGHCFLKALARSRKCEKRPKDLGRLFRRRPSKTSPK
jgi:hypothetical protein